MKLFLKNKQGTSSGDKVTWGHGDKGTRAQHARGQVSKLARWRGEISSGGKLASGHVGEGRCKDTGRDAIAPLPNEIKDTRTARSAPAH